MNFPSFYVVECALQRTNRIAISEFVLRGGSRGAGGHTRNALRLRKAFHT